jgi:isocitrate lyase
MILRRRLFLPKAVERVIQNKSSLKDKADVYEIYLNAVDGKSNNQAREIAADMIGEPVFWDCDRT